MLVINYLGPYTKGFGGSPNSTPLNLSSYYKKPRLEDFTTMAKRSQDCARPCKAAETPSCESKTVRFYGSGF